MLHLASSLSDQFSKFSSVIKKWSKSLIVLKDTKCTQGTNFPWGLGTRRNPMWV